MARAKVRAMKKYAGPLKYTRSPITKKAVGTK